MVTFGYDYLEQDDQVTLVIWFEIVIVKWNKSGTFSPFGATKGISQDAAGQKDPTPIANYYFSFPTTYSTTYYLRYTKRYNFVSVEYRL